MIGDKIPTILVGKNYVYLVEDKGLVEFKNIEELTKNISAGQVNLILSSDTAYFKTFSFPIDTTVDKAKIKQELQKQIPLDLDQTNWQYKLLSKNKKTQEYWAFAPEINSLAPFIKTLEKNSLEVGGLSSLPFLVSQNLPQYKDPALIIFQKEKIKFILIIKENQFWIYNLPNNTDLKTTVSDLIKLTKNRLQFEIKNIIATSDQDLSDLKLKIEKRDFDFTKIKFLPLIDDYGIETNKKNKNLEQAEASNDDQENNNINNEKNHTEEKKPKISKKTIGLILILIASFILMLTVIWFRFFKNTEKEVEPPNTESALEQIAENNSLESTPKPSPSPEFFANLYSVQILNGAGVAGLAGETQSLLEENGFKDLKTGNADNPNYTQTEIITDDEELKAELTKILEKDFQINPQPSNSSLPEEFDAMIILGQN